jgi:hypothetical protein
MLVYTLQGKRLQLTDAQHVARLPQIPKSALMRGLALFLPLQLGRTEATHPGIDRWQIRLSCARERNWRSA